MNILMIEDNAQNRYLVRFLMEARGHGVAEAVDGPTGIAAAQMQRPDLIMLDIQMPQMDGYAVARALRQLPSFDAVPIVAVTSFALSGDREKALAAGCDGYIEKPIDPDTFATEIEALARARAQQRGFRHETRLGR